MYPDSEAPNLYVRVTSKGTKSFTMRYWIDGRERNYTIGQYPTWKIADARTEARELKKEINKGNDPLKPREERRGVPYVSDLVDRYNEHFAGQPGRSAVSINDYKTNGKRIKKYLGSLKVDEMTRADVEKMHRDVGATGKTRLANKLLTQVSAMITFANDEYELNLKRVTRKIKRFPESKRTRWLRKDELNRLTAAIAKARRTSGLNLVKFLLLTGARRGEAMRASWDQLDLERGTWTKPSHHTKQRKTHVVPLSGPAVELLKSIKETSRGKVVFPGNVDPNTPITDCKKIWSTLVKEAELDDVRLHDLRHSYASHLVTQGLSLHVVGQLLGHTKPETTNRYAHLSDEALRDATEIVGKIVSGEE